MAVCNVSRPRRVMTPKMPTESPPDLEATRPATGDAASRPPWWRSWRVMLALWLTIGALVWLGLYYNVDARVIAAAVFVIGLVSNAFAWLLGIVHHKALSMLRRKPTEDLDTAEDLQDPAMPTPAEQAASREDSRQVKQAVARLSAEHRAVLELVFYQGLSLDETAAVLNCPLGTVKSRLSYAKASLRGELTRQGWNAEER